MFRRILIANRGEIAVRAVRACREMGITAVALYDASDVSSLHVRLADECVQVPSPGFFMDATAVIKLAQERGVDAIYPGYGFLAEEPEFVAACEAAGIVFIGPSAAIMAQTRDKLRAIQRVQAAGFETVICSPQSYGRDDAAILQETADTMGYPLVIKSIEGGRGRGSRLVPSSTWLSKAIQEAQHSSLALYQNLHVYLEKAIMPAHQISVQILSDGQGNILCLGEREGSIMYHNQKVVEESPAPFLTDEMRKSLCATAVSIAQLFAYQNVGSVEFLVTDDGRFYFSEIKARIQVEHPLTEIRSGIDLVQAQIRVAAGEPLPYPQEAVQLRGHALMVRIHAEDPWNHFWPKPGRLQRLRLPTGPDVRVDTYAYSGCYVPAAYNVLFAKLTTWGPNREAAIARLDQALTDFVVIGLPTNTPLLQQIVCTEAFADGRYHTGSLKEPEIREAAASPHLQDLAIAAAITYVQRNQAFSPTVPDRLLSGWHRDSRRLG
ncbi:MAG: ATP-grasp domain-containing protein [Anaerolineae bacterium]|nr:ATP-grasp domain-containing protein [Anaerolineae bacterium]